MKNFAICTLSCLCEETYIPGSHHFYMLVIKSWVGPGSEAMKYMYVYIQVGVQHMIAVVYLLVQVPSGLLRISTCSCGSTCDETHIHNSHMGSLPPICVPYSN